MSERLYTEKEVRDIVEKAFRAALARREAARIVRRMAEPMYREVDKLRQLLRSQVSRD